MLGSKTKGFYNQTILKPLQLFQAFTAHKVKRDLLTISPAAPLVMILLSAQQAPQVYEPSKFNDKGDRLSLKSE